MITRVSSAAALAVASVFILAGCSFSLGGPTTVSSDDIADLAEEALEDEFDDSSWKVNCDDDDEEVEVKLEEDESIDCLATDKDTDLEYDAEVTITDVKGDEYEIEVELADEANNADDVEDNADDEDSNSNGDTYYVSAEDLAALAVEALGPEIGFEPTDMQCETEETEIYVGNYDYCYFTDPSDGTEYTVDVTIDSFDEETGEYTIWAQIL